MEYRWIVALVNNDTFLTIFLFTGLQNYLCYSNSILYAKCGGEGRASSLAVAILSSMLFFVGPHIASYIPRCMAGTLLLHIGIDLILEGVYDCKSCSLTPHGCLIFVTLGYPHCIELIFHFCSSLWQVWQSRICRYLAYYHCHDCLWYDCCTYCWDHCGAIDLRCSVHYSYQSYSRHVHCILVSKQQLGPVTWSSDYTWRR